MKEISEMLSHSNLMRYFPSVILPAVRDTIIMVSISAVLAIFFGMMLGIVLILTAPDGLCPRPLIYRVLGKATDIVRSFPMLILMVALAPLTRAVMGTKIGVEAAIFAITIGSTPFATRMTENALRTVDPRLITMAQSVGATNLQIVCKVMIVESLPTIVSNFTILLINMLNTSAMAGAVGAGGLGAVALTYGYQRFDYPIMYFIVIVLVVIVMAIQAAGNKLCQIVR